MAMPRFCSSNTRPNSVAIGAAHFARPPGRSRRPGCGRPAGLARSAPGRRAAAWRISSSAACAGTPATAAAARSDRAAQRSDTPGLGRAKAVPRNADQAACTPEIGKNRCRRQAACRPARTAAGRLKRSPAGLDKSTCRCVQRLRQHAFRQQRRLAFRPPCVGAGQHARADLRLSYPNRREDMKATPATSAATATNCGNRDQQRTHSVFPCRAMRHSRVHVPLALFLVRSTSRVAGRHWPAAARRPIPADP